MNYRVILGSGTINKADAYANGLASGAETAGAYLSQLLPEPSIEMTARGLLQLLLQTKKPQIFAESAVVGDGSDWNPKELNLLGDISIAVDVLIYDDGRHQHPEPHDPPFPGTLAFTCGALLANGRGDVTPDLAEVQRDGSIDAAAYRMLYARRLLPVFAYIQEAAKQRGRYALVTIPGLGCGQFAGRFASTLGTMLQQTLESLFTENAQRWNRIKVAIFDPFRECSDFSISCETTQFRVRPLLNSRNPHPQLCPAVDYQEAGDDFADCDLYSLVAWDQVSWPGNDFFIGSRSTDDGVKAAATDSMRGLTGIEGHYDIANAMYQPPRNYRTWKECVQQTNTRLQLGEPFIHE